MLIRLVLACALIFGLAGCATSKKKPVNAEMESLQTKVSDLETEVQQKDERIRELEEQTDAVRAKSGNSVSVMDTGTLSTKEIQIALKNAGYYAGAIDGQIGPKTKRAIKEFQRANGLTADGVVGKMTKAKLREHLSGE